MLYYLATVAGCLTIYYPTFVLLHWALVKRVIADRYASNVAAAVATYPLCILGTGYWRYEYYHLYLIPAAIVLWVAFGRGRQARRRKHGELDTVFD
jgi:hypothetical protein